MIMRTPYARDHPEIRAGGTRTQHNPELHIISIMPSFALSQERLLLQDLPWRARGRRLHEPDPHVRTLRGQSLRLPHRVGLPCGLCRRESAGLAALDLSGHAGRLQWYRPLTEGTAAPAAPPLKILHGCRKDTIHGHSRAQ